MGGSSEGKSLIVSALTEVDHNQLKPGEFLCLSLTMLGISYFLMWVARLQEFHGSARKFVPLQTDCLGLHLTRLLSYCIWVTHTIYSVSMWHFSASSEPSSPPFASETAPSSSGPSETLKAPFEPSLSPTPRTPEKEAQRDGEVEVPPEGETEEEKAIRLLYCSLCKVAVNSASQLQAHNSGERLLAPLPSS